ncbi:MAG: carboxypeptidase-like regulatory domain-containing protein [Anaerolineae bacterium]
MIGLLALALFAGLALGAVLGAPAAVSLADATPATYVQIPVLGYVGNDTAKAEWVIEAQNIGSTWTKVALLLFSDNQGLCQPQAAPPFKLECSGLLTPGSAWTWTNAQLPGAARSAIAFSFSPSPANNPNYYRCDQVSALRGGAWPEGWPGVSPTPGQFPFTWSVFAGQPIAVEVVRKKPGNTNPTFVMSGSYNGVNAAQAGRYDPTFGGYAYYAPAVYSGYGGFNSWLYIQNGGTECTSVELWFKAQDECLRSQICSISQLSPGYAAVFNVSTCLPQGVVTAAWLRASQPLAIVADQIGPNLLMTYNGVAAEPCYAATGGCLDDGGGSQVAYGPLTYREEQGWDTRIYVQNLSGTTAAKVKVYFLDHGGGIVTTMVDWVCPRGAQLFYLPLVNNLPGNYVGAVRVESQAWTSPGDPLVSAPNITATAELVQYSGSTGSSPTQAVAYNLISENEGYTWQAGAGQGGLSSGVGLIAVPSLLQRGNSLGLETSLAIQNIVPYPGFTDFVLFIYDQNGLIDYVCEQLGQQSVEYIDFSTWGVINAGFKGSAVISATYWQHDVFAPNGAALRNLVGLGAVKIERVVPNGSLPIASDVASASEGFPMPPGFDFGGFPVVCPGIPTTCAPVTLTLTACNGSFTSPGSIYAGATVTLTDMTGSVVGAQTLSAAGVVSFPNLTSGRPYTVQVSAPRKPVPFPSGGVDSIDLAAFTQAFTIPCQSVAGNVSISLGPPTGVVAGYLVASCSGGLSQPQANAEVQLWLPPGGASNTSGVYLQSAYTNADGYFRFRPVNPCLTYDIRAVIGSSTLVASGILGGAETVQTGPTATQPQQYVISAANGQVCDVRPDPP